MCVFQACVSGISEEAARDRIGAISHDIKAAERLYEQHACNHELYKIPALKGKNDTIVAGKATKGDLINLYSQYLVGKGKPGRVIYERLLGLAPHKLCPQCGFGHVKTLDHYLPKSKYPLYAVTPQNLVPACRDCNTGKRASAARSSGEQSIHPYFDPDHFFQEQWLFAEVVESSPAAIRFFVQAPDGWDNNCKERIQAHFDGFGLGDRFSVQVATELAAIRLYLADMQSEEARRLHLQDRARGYSRLHKNSWQTALAQALAESRWYWQDGFNLF